MCAWHRLEKHMHGAQRYAFQTRHSHTNLGISSPFPCPSSTSTSSVPSAEVSAAAGAIDSTTPSAHRTSQSRFFSPSRADSRKTLRMSSVLLLVVSSSDRAGVVVEDDMGEMKEGRVGPVKR
jgi:hypothetical protein